MPIQSQVYISEKATGHKVEFLIISKDSVHIETYTMRYKLPYFPLKRKVEEYGIKQRSENVIKTNNFDVIRESSDILSIGKVRYFKYLIIDLPGDFIYINKLFGNMSNIERLSSCRSFYDKLHPVSKIEKPRSTSDITHFFTCMTSNEYSEKIAKNNYYIFDTTDGYLYYGKVHSGFFRGKIAEIYKVDIDVLCKQLPNFRRLNGAELRKIVVSDIAKANGISNKSEITVKNISYQLDDVIIVFIDFVIEGQEQQKTYKLNTIDFSIVN